MYRHNYISELNCDVGISLMGGDLLNHSSLMSQSCSGSSYDECLRIEALVSVFELFNGKY